MSLIGLLKERAFTIIPNGMLPSLQLGQGVGLGGRWSGSGAEGTGTGTTRADDGLGPTSTLIGPGVGVLFGFSPMYSLPFWGLTL